jgi:hypothetical protein
VLVFATFCVNLGSFAVKIFKASNRKDRKGSQSSRRNSALKTKILSPREMGKEAQEWLKVSSHSESHVPRFRVESWHLAAAIYDPGPVAVAS